MGPLATADEDNTGGEGEQADENIMDSNLN